MLAIATAFVTTLLAAIVEPAFADSNRCVQRSMRDLRPIADSCTKFHMCSLGTLITFSCPHGSVFHQQSGSCVPEGSQFDTCTHQTQGGFLPTATACPRGATYKKAHPDHCARFYDCGKSAMHVHWDSHEWECEYPMLFNEATKRCEHFSMVSCGFRQEPFDPCEYKANTCDGHTHCVPCKVRYPSCRNLQDGINEWKGKPLSPYYVVCHKQRVIYSGMCTQEYGEQIFDKRIRTCRPANERRAWWQ